MTILHQLRRTAHRTLLALGVVMLVAAVPNADAKVADMGVRSHQEASAQDRHCPPDKDASTVDTSPACCQQDCHCPLASGGSALWLPTHSARDFLPNPAAADFPSVQLPSSLLPQDLLRPPI